MARAPGAFRGDRHRRHALWALTSDLTPPAVDGGVGYYWPLWAALGWAILVALHGLHGAGLLPGPGGRERVDPAPRERPVAPILGQLTERERQVMSQLARGRSNKQVALALGIGERTARTHVSNILLKLGLASRTEAALLAARETGEQNPSAG